MNSLLIVGVLSLNHNISIISIILGFECIIVTRVRGQQLFSFLNSYLIIAEKCIVMYKITAKITEAFFVSTEYKYNQVQQVQC